jgi:hypothetical protein
LVALDRIGHFGWPHFCRSSKAGRSCRGPPKAHEMIRNFSEIVKDQIEYWHDQMAERGSAHPRHRPAKVIRYKHLIEELSQLLIYLQSQENRAVPTVQRDHRSQRKRSKVSLVSTSRDCQQTKQKAEPDDLSDLPPKLLKELREIGKTDPLIAIIDRRGGTATLDEILIDLYREYRKIGTRTIVKKRLLFLSRRGLCWLAPDAAGHYTTIKPHHVHDERPSAEGDKRSRTSTSKQGAN